MIIWIGIDDTDNLDSRGTGYIARTLAEHLYSKGFGHCDGISRHQLLVDSAIPYTSHNSSLCLKWVASHPVGDDLIQESACFLKDHSAPGSDPGLCVVSEEQTSSDLIQFGQNAKIKVLTKQSAIDLAKTNSLHLSEHGGTGGGIIGALAGVGLAVSGNDGRFVWLKGIREVTGTLSASQILEKTGIKKIQTTDGAIVSEDDLIDTGEWFRPVLLNHQPVLLVEASQTSPIRWKILDRETIKIRY